MDRSKTRRMGLHALSLLLVGACGAASGDGCLPAANDWDGGSPPLSPPAAQSTDLPRRDHGWARDDFGSGSRLEPAISLPRYSEPYRQYGPDREPLAPTQTTPSYWEASLAYYEAYCWCGNESLDSCTGTSAEGRACEQAMTDGAQTQQELDWLACVAAAFQLAGDCIARDGCGRDDVGACAHMGQQQLDDCGSAPLALQQAVDQCHQVNPSTTPERVTPEDAPMAPTATCEIPTAYECDGIPDCEGEADELGCPTFLCKDGGEFLEKALCNGYSDCADDTDENGCPTFACDDQLTVARAWVCDTFIDCPDGTDEDGCQYTCPDGVTDIEADQLCNGITDCGDGFDEEDCTVTCLDDPQRLAVPCDDAAECLDASDEQDC